MSALITLYLKKIRKGELTIEQVPPRWREEVQIELNKDNGE